VVDRGSGCVNIKGVASFLRSIASLLGAGTVLWRACVKITGLLRLFLVRCVNLRKLDILSNRTKAQAPWSA